MVWMVMIVVTVVAIMAEILNPYEIVLAVMRMTIYLALMSVLTVLVESGWMVMMAGLNMMKLLRSMLHWYYSRVKVSLKLWWRNVMHESLVFQFLRSTAVPSLLLCEPSIAPGHPFLTVTMMTSNEAETLASGLIPGSRASFLNLDAPDHHGPAHCMLMRFFGGTVDVNNVVG